MKRCAKALLSSACAVLAMQSQAQFTNRVTYTLLQESYLLDECLICGRPDILEPLRGTFNLVRLDDYPPYTAYAVQNINFVAGAGTSLERRLAGQGTYTRFEEFAELQDMDLALTIKDSYTNRSAFFTNDSRQIEQPFPLIAASLRQTNGTLLQTFSLNLFAAPVTEIWFSTSRAFNSTNEFGKTNPISGGDLISNRGRVVKRNLDLVGRLGLMPVVADLGLDAVFVTRHGEILFSLPVTVFSEKLGWLQHGDLLSNRGSIVKRNQDLLAAFHPGSTNDAGLDAVQLLSNGEILFSIQSNVVAGADVMLSRGDLLSDQGNVFMTHQQLLAAFQPPDTNHDYGLRAFYIFPSGEIWFSVEEGFTDNRLGAVQAGDLLSNFGYRVFSNQDLVAAFAPTDPTLDYGLDSLFVVTDTAPSAPPPRILAQAVLGNSFHLEWDGEGAVFQVENAPSLLGPWSPSSEIIPDLSFDASFDPAAAASGFYRLRQW